MKLFYQKIAEFAQQKLTKGGQLFFELNEFNASEVQQLLQEKDFKSIELRQDLNEKDRMLRAEKAYFSLPLGRLSSRIQ